MCVFSAREYIASSIPLWHLRRPLQRTRDRDGSRRCTGNPWPALHFVGETWPPPIVHLHVVGQTCSSMSESLWSLPTISFATCAYRARENEAWCTRCQQVPNERKTPVLDTMHAFMHVLRKVSVVLLQGEGIFEALAWTHFFLPANERRRTRLGRRQSRCVIVGPFRFSGTRAPGSTS